LLPHPWATYFNFSLWIIKLKNLFDRKIRILNKDVFFK
jgi:hypothetical protein